AMLAVSYDDEKYGGAIEVLNSWGKQWGNNGFAWIRYSDCLKWFSGVYAFFLDNSSVSMNNNSAADDSFAMSADSSATVIAGSLKKDSVLKADAVYMQLFKNK
ncbi:MAG TPA: hypothetical protein VI757_08640, partial [Bacteroidia bacterium]|nr:hypothetical protein [Bacteroidia bacterium]